MPEDEPANVRLPYRQARQAAAILLIALVAVIVIGDMLMDGYAVDPLVLVPLLLAAAGLLAVDIPGLGGKR